MDDSKGDKGIDPDRLKRFVKHMCILAKKHRDREQARIDLKKQMERLKRFSSKKKEMDEELKELNRKVSLVLEKEAQLVGIKRGEHVASKQIMSLAVENKYRIGQINSSINEIKSRLQGYIEARTARERKIAALENKIKNKTKTKKGVLLLKSKLKKLEGIYNKLKKKGDNVSRLESRMKGLRLKLDFLS
ncbi:MAG: hypothetical protein KJ561_02730 [Nanoarchaeota archaeon]|nr:hypothetical protein [Nanoarchaeota archaeon]